MLSRFPYRLIGSRTLYSAILSMVVLFSCQKSYLNPLDDFTDKNEIELFAKKIVLSSDTILFRPYTFQVYDSLAIFNDNTGEAGFSIIDLKSGELIKRFGFSGSEESELDINAISMENGTVNYDAVFSITQRNPPYKIFRYQWDSLITLLNYKPKPLFYPQGFGFSHSFFLNDSTVFGKFSFSKYDDRTFGLINLSTNKLSTGVEVPGKESKKYYSEKDSLYFKYLNSRMDNRVAYRPGSLYEFASFSLKGAVIQLIKVDSDHQIEKKFQKVYYLPTFNILKGPDYTKVVAGNNSKKGFNSIAANKEDIFALYNGPLSNDSEENFDNSDIILVFDWEGNPKYRIKLNKKVQSIAIDRVGLRYLYGVTDSLQILKFTLPKH